MGASRKWINKLLGLKKSEKIASSEEENSSGNESKCWNQSKSSVENEKGRFENEKGRFENELNDNGEIEYEDANWQWEMDQAGAPSTSLQAKSSAEVSDDRKEENGAQQQPQEDLREELMEIYAKDANYQSALDSPNSPEVENAARIEGESGEGWATPDVREPFESDPDPTSPNSSSIEVEYALLQDNRREEFEAADAEYEEHVEKNWQESFAVRRIQTAIRGFLLQIGAKSETRLPLSEESAATRIQTVYRGFRARRAFRAIKGLARLEALVKGHTVKRQTAIALRCIQALVKVQAQSQAKHVRIASDNKSVQQKLMQQLDVGAPVPAPVKKAPRFKFDGWCDKVGSAAEVQARMLKRQEAAAKREKARAYALARQWQAGIRYQPQPQPQPQPQQQKEEETAPGASLHTAKTEWGWNWLERWMAVRPWETHFIEETKEGAKSPVDEPRSPLTERKPSSIGTVKTKPRLSNTLEKRATDGCSPSPRKPGTTQESPTTPLSSRSPKTLASRPNFGSRSFSTPRERSNLSDAPEKKRLSLPGTISGAKLLAQTAVKSPRTQSPKAQSPRVQSPRTPQSSRSKLNNDAKLSKLSR